MGKHAFLSREVVGLRPRNNLVLVRFLKQKESRTDGGVIVPHNIFAEYDEAEVVSVGEGEWLESGQRRSLGLEPGDTVLVRARERHGPQRPVTDNGVLVEVAGENLHLVMEHNIVAVLTLNDKESDSE